MWCVTSELVEDSANIRVWGLSFASDSRNTVTTNGGRRSKTGEKIHYNGGLAVVILSFVKAPNSTLNFVLLLLLHYYYCSRYARGSLFTLRRGWRGSSPEKENTLQDDSFFRVNHRERLRTQIIGCRSFFGIYASSQTDDSICKNILTDISDSWFRAVLNSLNSKQIKTFAEELEFKGHSFVACLN